MGLPLPGLREIEHLFVETAVATFGRGDGIVRVEWSRKKDAPPELIATPRPTGAEPDIWRVVRSRATHPGPERRRNTKYVTVDAYDIAREETADPAVNEVLLFDSNGFLVEGGRSNFLIVTCEGELATPARELGGVEGLGLTIVLESFLDTKMARLRQGDIVSARELISVNAVRGTIPIVEFDGRLIADGQPGPWAQRLKSLF